MKQSLASASYVASSEADIVDLDPGIKRQILGYGAELMTCRIYFESGAVGSVHCHPHSQTTYVESGRFLFQVDGKKSEAGPGDCIYIAPNLMHGSTCLETGTLIDNFSPLRADFLEQEQVA